MIKLEDIVEIRNAKHHDKGYEIVLANGKSIWLIKRRTIVGLLLLLKYEVCSEEDLVGTNGRLREIKHILNGKYDPSLIKDRYGDANKPFSELWTEEGFSSIHAEGLQGNRKYVLRKADHETLFNESGKTIREQLSKETQDEILKRQSGRCNFFFFFLRRNQDIHPHTFAKDRVTMEFDHRIPVDRGGKSDISNYQALCHYCNKCKRQICFICKEKCCDQCALVSPETSSTILPTGENISDRFKR